MARPSISVPEELLEDFDDVVWHLEMNGDLPRDVTRSAVMQQLMQEFVDDHRDVLDESESGKRTPANTVLAD
jgi:metal-responsive CopG/Arc/MetJ family transcriptional regulator